MSSQKAEVLAELEALVAERDRRRSLNRLETFRPYEFQKRLLASSRENAQTLLMAANQVGKTLSGGANMAYHLTGLYPDWWEGHKWQHPIDAWAAGVSAESTRDIIQAELMGPPDDPMAKGTGWLPLNCIGLSTRKPQVPNAIQSVLVRHHTNGVFDGWSRLTFKAFEQGDKKFMGRAVHEIWLDEQPPDSLFGQCVTRTVTTGGHVTMTFTPEDGVTKVVADFTRSLKPGQQLINATWEDAPHLTEERKQQLLSVYDEHERDMRTKGIPMFGSGPVFTTAEDDLLVDPFEIPGHWVGICGLDIGWDHPTAAVWMYWDRDADTVYVTDEYRKRKAVIAIHASALNARPRVPIAWPHDGEKHDPGSGATYAQQYRDAGCNMLPFHFTNPPVIGDKSGGNYNVEPGISAMNTRMQEGRFKVFRTCREWREEYRMYHRENGKIWALDDDLMSATRYAHQMLRYAELPQAPGLVIPFNKKITYIEQEYLA